MNNQAVIDIEDYYSMRKNNEKLLEEVERLKDLNIENVNSFQTQITKLKGALILAITNTRGMVDELPKYEISSKDSKLTITIRPNVNISDRFNDVEVIIGKF